MADVLLHSCTVYFYLYDAQTGSYAQQGDSAVGCALLATPEGPSPFHLLIYNAQKKPLLQTAVTAQVQFTPQQNNYVNFYDQAKKNYSMRFKDAADATAFLSAAAYVKAQLVIQAAFASGGSMVVAVEELALGKEDGRGQGVATGDVAGVSLSVWKGSKGDAMSSMENPLDLAKLPATESTDLRRIHLIDAADIEAGTDALTRALSTQALHGMQKGVQRLVTVVLPETQEWIIVHAELVKVKKASSKSTTSKSAATKSVTYAVTEEPQEEKHSGLVERMANLSRVGSEGSSGLIASLKKRQSNATAIDTNETSEYVDVRHLSSGGSTPPGYVPVLLEGLQLPGSRRSSSSNMTAAIEASASDVSRSPSQSSGMSLAAKVIAPLKAASATSSYESSSFAASSSTSAASAALSLEMEQLMKEQSELAELQKQLEESKKNLQQETPRSPSARPSENRHASSRSSNPALIGASPLLGMTNTGTNGANGFGSFQNPLGSSSSGFTPSSSFSSGSDANGFSTANLSQWTPPKSSFDLVPSFTPSSLPLSMGGSTPQSTFASSSLTPYLARSPPPAPLYSTPSSLSTPGLSSSSTMELENNMVRLQRSSTSMESSLQDLHSKMDRLLNMQSGVKSVGKYTSSAGLFSGSSSGSSSLSSSGFTAGSSSSSLLKNLEKALAQRDQLQELNNRLQDAHGQLESAVEELQSQQEALQLENRNLLDKVQNSSQLQQDKFRLELRSVQQQMSHAQEQMLVYQEENFQLRSQLAAKDDQAQREKQQWQEENRKQLEQLQRQLQSQVQQNSQEALDSLTREKTQLQAQVKEFDSKQAQWETERSTLASQLQQAQRQVAQFKETQANTHAAQDAQVQELEAQVDQLRSESARLRQQLERSKGDTQHLQDLLAEQEHTMAQWQDAKSSQEHAALSDLLKELMDDVYAYFQNTFDEDTEFTGKEVIMATRKILKQNTMDVLVKLEQFWQTQAQNNRSR